jgi:hypothetical protein
VDDFDDLGDDLDGNDILGDLDDFDDLGFVPGSGSAGRGLSGSAGGPVRDSMAIGDR